MVRGTKQKRPLSAAAQAKRDKLIEQNLAIVSAIARQVSASAPSSFALEDLASIGTIALCEAAERYRPAQHAGAPFSAYARFRVRGAMLDSIKGRHYARVKSTQSIDEAHEPAIEPDTADRIDQAAQTKRVFAAIAQLPKQQHREILTMHYQFSAQLVEIAAHYGVHPSRITHLHTEAIRELRKLAATGALY
jgi:RNA polymerase sigma factor (sigma-70 family)